MVKGCHYLQFREVQECFLPRCFDLCPPRPKFSFEYLECARDCLSAGTMIWSSQRWHGQEKPTLAPSQNERAALLFHLVANDQPDLDPKRQLGRGRNMGIETVATVKLPVEQALFGSG